MYSKKLPVGRITKIAPFQMHDAAMLSRAPYYLLVLLLMMSGCRERQDDEVEAEFAPEAVDVQTNAPDRLEALFANYDLSLASPDPLDSAAAQAWMDEVVARLSLEEKIGQLIIADLSEGGIRGLFSDMEALVQDHHIGGFLVPRLMKPRDVFERTRQLQQVADVPLLFAADYERGVGRFTNRLTELPSNMAVGATRDTVFAAAMGRLTAVESRAIGINIVFAPVVDVNSNPDNPIINIRSYGEEPELVGRMAGAYVREAQQYGLQTTLKHFPGHGDTAVDTHARMAVVRGSRAELDSVELRPYRMIVRQEVPPAAIMSAHLWVQAVDPEPV